MKQMPEQIVSDKVRPFWPGLFEEAGGAAKLLASRCSTCGSYFFPTRSQCPNCAGTGSLEQVQISGRGTIYASTVVRVPSPVGLKPPYACGYVDLADVKLRVFALFTGTDVDQFKPGRQVEMVIEPLRTDAKGDVLSAYKFKLI
jgi:uncharacterized OB-fold protein